MKNATIPSRSFKFGRLRPRFWRTLLLVLALPLADGSAANAAPFQNGDFTTYVQGSWGTSSSAAGTLLTANFNSVYAATFNTVTVGLPTTGFTMTFDAPTAVFNYLPAGGSPGTLNGNLLDPTSTSSGTFGGDVLALQFDVDFSKAGFLVHSSGIPFGSLVLQNFSTLPALNGLTVSQFLGDANTCLGGGSCIESIGVMDTVTADLTGSFSGGIVQPPITSNGVDFSTQVNLALPPSAVPLPGALPLFISGLVGLVLLGWRRKQKAIAA